MVIWESTVSNHSRVRGTAMSAKKIFEQFCSPKTASGDTILFAMTFP